MRKTPLINSSLNGRPVVDDIMRLFDGDPLPDTAQADVAGVLSIATGKSTDGLPKFNAAATGSTKNAGSAATPLDVDRGSTVTVGDGASVEISGDSAQSVRFTGVTGTLKIDHSIAFTGPVSGLTGADALDLADIGYGAKTTATFSGNASGGKLTVIDGTHTANIALKGNYLTSGWTLSSDGQGGTIVVDPPLNDGSANAPVGPAQLPALLNSYAVRPPWKVAGVDYAVGYSTGTALKDWQTINLPGVSISKEGGANVVTITGNNVTLNGYDFSLHGGAQVLVQGSNDTVSNSKFVYTSAMTGYYTLIGVTPSASNFTLKYCVLDGNAPALGQGAANQTALIGNDGSGTTNLQYNWFLNFNQHVVEMSGTGSLDYQFNLIENGASGATGQHLNFLQFSSPGSYNPVTVQFNTTYQPKTNPSGGEGFQLYNNGSGNITGTLAYNTMIASPDGSGLPHISEYPSGGGGVTTASVHDNYISKGGSPTYFYDLQNSFFGDIDLVTGAAIDKTTVASPVIKSFLPDTGIVGDGITNANKLELKGTADPNSTITVYDGSTKLGTTTADSTGSWDYITAVLTNAKHVLTATETNASGQTSAASAPLTVTVDTHVPAAPVLVSDSVVNTNHILLSGTAEANSTITVYDGTTVVGTGTSSSTGAWSVTTGALSSGTHALTATATDVAGTVSAASQSLNPVIPATPPLTPPAAPTIASFSPDTGVVGDGITDVNNVTLTGTAVANSTVKIFDGTTQIGTATANGSGQWSLTTPALSDGTHNLTATDTDSSGQTSAPSAAFSVTVDTHMPAAPVLVSDPIVNTNHVQLSGTAEANSAITVYDGSTVVGTGTTSATGAWSITTTALSSGAHALTATATDVAGTTSAMSNALDPVIPGAPTGPTAPIIVSFSPDTGSAGDHITNDNAPTLTGKAVAGSTVDVFDGTEQIGTTTADSNGQWSLATSELSDGSHSLTATDTDASGHTSAASEAFSITIDTHEPDAPTMTAYSHSGAAVDSTTTLHDLVLKGTAEANSKIDIFDGENGVGTATTSDSGTWTFEASHLANGSHSFTATATDAAGTTSALSEVDEITVMEPESTVGFTSLSENSSHVATIKGTADANSQIKLHEGNTLLGTVKAADDGSWSFTTGHLSNKVHVFTAQEVDSTGQVVATSSGETILGSTHGHSTLTSTSGNDLLVGNSHSDTFVFAANFGNDVIQDFISSGKGHDTIQFSKNVFDSFASVLSHASQAGQDVVISTGGDTLTLKNTKLGALNSHDFHFA